jgi:chloramphenicol 3-O phosphotransferase
MAAGWVVVLNGAPRSGKSSIAAVIQETFDGPWMNLGTDVFSRHVTPPRYRPGMGLRPGGGERPDIEALIPALYAAFYDSVAAHARHGLNVVADVGHHDAYATPLHPLRDAARRLRGLPALLVGVRCPIEEIMRRRAAAQPAATPPAAPMAKSPTRYSAGSTRSTSPASTTWNSTPQPSPRKPRQHQSGPAWRALPQPPSTS